MLTAIDAPKFHVPWSDIFSSLSRAVALMVAAITMKVTEVSATLGRDSHPNQAPATPKSSHPPSLYIRLAQWRRDPSFDRYPYSRMAAHGR
jgi:hypothetical protein